MIVRYTEWILRWRYLVLLLSLIGIVAVGSGLPKLSFTQDYRVFFSKDNPQLNAFENLQNTYTKNDNVLFVVAPKDGQVFSKQTLAAVKDITEQSWQIPYSIRVDSITNFQHTYAEEDDLIVGDLVEDPMSMSQADLHRVQDIALREPMLVNRLVSADSTHTGINVIIQLPGVNQMEENPQVVRFVRNMHHELSARYPELEIRPVGIVLLNNAFQEASISDGQTLIPMAFAAITVTLLLLLRGISGTAATVILVMFSIVTAMGLAGHMGIRLTPPSASAPIIILTIAIAGAVHLLVTMLQEIHRGMSKHDAIIESMRVNFQPIFLTSLTTTLGFLSLNSSDAPPFGDLGNIATFGVIAAFILTVTFLPAIMYVLPIKATHFVVGTKSMSRLGDFVVNKRNSLLAGVSVAVLLVISQVPNNELNDIFVNYFDDSVPFRVNTDYATENLTGTYSISYSIDSGKTGRISDPGFLEKVDEFANWYRKQPEVLHVSSITDTFKRLNRNMHEDRNEYYRLPQNRELAAQYLLLYEMSLPYGLDLNNQVDVDKRATRINVTLETISSNQILDLEERANSWMHSNMPNYVTHGASPAIMFAHIGRRNITSMLTGTTIALALISGVLVLALRSFKYGIISLIPNLFPAASAFGLWAIFVGEIGLALSVVTAMTLGVVVDDTVHFMSKYIRARKENNLNTFDAVRYAFRNVGVALWVTSIALIAGFMILSRSAFELNSSMGLMTSLIIAIALLLDFLMLPPLLMKLDASSQQELKLAEQQA
jgi:hypothetical protein